MTISTLYLLRHAKSDWSDPTIDDHGRPLNERGRRAAKFMGEFMQKNAMIPEMIACSTAKRTVETLDLLIPSFANSPLIEYDERIYEASTTTLIYLLEEYRDHPGNLMIIGHNPGIEALIYALTARQERIPTATLAVIEMSDTPRLSNIFRPKELM